MRGNSGRFAFALWHCGLVSAAAAVLLAAFFTIGYAPPAEALPSYARQTGQPCGTCHTDFAGLTPYGRLFKIKGYTTRRRSVSHDTVPELRRCRQERAKALGTAALDDDGCRIYQHAGAAATADRAIQCKQQYRAVFHKLHVGRRHHRSHRCVCASELQCATRRRVWQRSIRTFLDLGQYGCSLCGFYNDRRLQRHLRHYRQQQSDRPGSLEHHAGLGLPIRVVELRCRIRTDANHRRRFCAKCGERRRLRVHQRCALP